jgi:hypothetical protein
VNLGRWYRKWDADYEPAFYADRRNLGLGGRNFDYFFRDIEKEVLDYPWEYSKEVPESGGTRMRLTRDAFLDVPPLYVYYKVNAEDCRVRFVGLSRAWSKFDVAPPPFRED